LFDLLRTNLSGVDEAQLNRAAVEGLLVQLHPKVALVDESTPPDAGTNAQPLVTTRVFDGAFGYIRLARVVRGVETEFAKAIQSFAATNKLKGLALDLRFAAGQDYAAAAALADSFLPADQPMLDWGEGLQRSTGKSRVANLPLAVLVNRKTSSAAEALAGILRQAEVGLLIGSNTAGQASISREFVLQTGQRLRIATTPVKFRDGRPLPAEGLKPDIHVDVAFEDELAYLTDPYRILPKPSRTSRLAGLPPGETNPASANRPARRRMNEADLVRMLREGIEPDLETNTFSRDSEPAPPAVQDPALARALDLLKGLAVLHQARSL
jgi:hypothetical protein